MCHITRRGLVHGPMVKLVEGDMTKGDSWRVFTLGFSLSSTFYSLIHFIKYGLIKNSSLN